MQGVCTCSFQDTEMKLGIGMVEDSMHVATIIEDQEGLTIMEYTGGMDNEGKLPPKDGQ